MKTLSQQIDESLNVRIDEDYSSRPVASLSTDFADVQNNTKFLNIVKSKANNYAKKPLIAALSNKKLSLPNAQAIHRAIDAAAGVSNRNLYEAYNAIERLIVLTSGNSSQVKVLLENAETIHEVSKNLDLIITLFDYLDGQNVPFTVALGDTDFINGDDSSQAILNEEQSQYIKKLCSSAKSTLKFDDNKSSRWHVQMSILT